VQLSNGITLANAFSLNGATNGPTDSISFSRIENLSGNNTISGNITWNSTGGLFTNISSTAGTLTLSGNVTTAVIVGSRTFNFTGSGDTIISGSISNGSATVGLTKNGSGTLTISGSGNTYSGSTTVSVGRLVVNGNLGTGTTTVASGATLGGSGSLGGLLAVNSGAFVAPGNSPGNLTLQAGLSLAGTYSWELGALSTANPGIDFDTITVTAGNVDLTGASLALNLGAFAPSADVFWTSSQTWSGIILNAGAGSLSGSFAAIDNSSWSSLGSFSTVIDGNDVNLVWTAVPEPGAAVLAVLGVLGMGIALRRKRR
jgi:autotransporter-associated beta strand protein